jgi:hypothetical protein
MTLCVGRGTRRAAKITSQNRALRRAQNLSPPTKPQLSLPRLAQSRASSIAAFEGGAGCGVRQRHRDGAPGGARELARLPSPASEAGVNAPRFQDPVSWGGWGSRGARALARSPAPPSAIAMSLSDTAPCSAFERRDRRRPRLSKARCLYIPIGIKSRTTSPSGEDK